MNKDINYPIKYAVLELKERGGWLVGYQDITQGFIVSKCYVVASNIVYNADGTSKITHNVVFPFKDIAIFKNSLRDDRYNIGDKEIPRYNACDMIYPIDIVTALFDSFEQAKVAAISKNEEFKNNLVMEVPDFWSSKFLDSDWQKQYETLKQKYEQNLEICNLFEELVLEETEDMNISEEAFDDRNAVKVLKPVKRQINDY